MPLKPTYFLLLALLCTTNLAVAEQEAFSSSPRELLQSVDKVGLDKASDITHTLVQYDYEIDSQNRVTLRLHRVYRVETQDGVEGWSSTSARYSPWRQDRPEIKVRVVTPDGVEHVLDPKMLVDAPSRDDNDHQVFDDNRVYQGPIPSVTKGAVVEEQIVIRDREPFFPDGVGRTIYVGSRSGPVEKTVVTIKAPASLPVRYLTRLLPNASVEKKEIGGVIEYRFEHLHMDTLESPEENLPDDVPSSPYFAFSTGKTWNAVATGYLGMTEPRIRTQDVEALVRRTTKAGDTREQIVRRLLAQLHKSVRYTGVEFAEAALVPALPAETLKRGYGDCKDKAVLLVAMLRAANLPAHLALLTASPGPDNEEDLPAMDFDHAIVYVPGAPDYWIDATAPDYQLGSVPPEDAGRRALVVREGTERLIQIPELKPEDNLIVEKREFFLAEYGPARVHEITVPGGIAEAAYREYYASNMTKERRDSFSEYVASAYLADKPPIVSHSDVGDLNVPFELKIEVEKGRRGITDLNEAVVAILPAGILNRFPEYLRAEDEELTEKERAQREKKARTADFVFTPFITEWQYKVVLPIGFKIRALPENRVEALGPAKVSYSYGKAPDGSLLATLRLDSVRGRYTAAEAETLRVAARQFKQRDAIMLGFDHTGHVLLTSGKIREGLREYESVVTKHPTEGLHHVQLASAMLYAGLCETARTEAKRATELDPNSARAFQMLGWVLQHDLVCRRFKKGFDYPGSVAAYKKAHSLDPDEAEITADLAILYEHGSDGYQYSPSSQLNDSVDIWLKLKETNSKAAKSFENNLLFDLMYARRFKELKEELANASMDVTHRAMALTATAELNNPTAAIEESYRLTTDESSRSNALLSAANYLIRLRDYAAVAEMLNASSRGQTDSAATLQRAEMFRRTKRADGNLYPPSDPRFVVQKSLIITMRNPDDISVYDYVVPHTLQGLTREQMREQTRKRQRGATFRSTLEKTGLNIDALIDIGLSNSQFSLEGDDRVGYRITMQAIGAKTQIIYVVKEGDKYLLLGSSSEPGDLAAEVLFRLDRNELEGARRLLDWIRSEISIAGGDDPLSGWIFPRLWTRGQEADADTMRAAALSMIVDRKDVSRWIPQIITARDRSTSETTRMYLERSLADSYLTTEDMVELRASALRLLKVYPKSNVAVLRLAAACSRLKDWQTWNDALQVRLKSDPANEDTLSYLARFHEAQGRLAEANSILKKLIDTGRATPGDLNEYGWNQLVMNNITADGIEQVRRAVSLQKSYNITHTLASMYAHNGNPQEARQLAIGIMDDNGMEEPDESLWFVFGQVAEAYGEVKEAQACYKRVHWTEKYQPEATSTYALAQKHLEGLAATKEMPAQAK